MKPCTQGSDRDHQTQSDFCKALGLLSIHPLPMEEEPPVFAPTIGERVKRNLLLSNKVVSYKNYYGNKDVALKLKSNIKLNKKKNCARKSSKGKALASSRNKLVEKEFLSPLTNLKSISCSNITNEFNEDNCRLLAQNLPFVNDFELSLEESHCQQVVSFYSPEKPAANSHLHMNKNYCNYSSPFKIKTCHVLLTKCPPISESVICELTSNCLPTNSLLEPTNDIAVKSASSSSTKSVSCVPSTDDLKDSVLDMPGANEEDEISVSESVIHVHCSDNLPNKSLFEPTSDITVKSAASVSESDICVPTTNGLHKEKFPDVITGASVHSVAHNCSKHVETIPDNYNLSLSTQSFRQNFASLTESNLPFNPLLPTSENIHANTSDHFEVETSLLYSYAEKESLKCTSPVNVSVESNTLDQLPDLSIGGCADVKCNVSDLLTLESGSSSPANFTIQIETQEELESQENVLSSAQESALHISEVFSLASSTCSSSSSTSSLKEVSSEDSDDNSSLAMEEAFHLPRIMPCYGVISSQSSPQVTPSIGTDKFLPLATTQYVNDESSLHNKLNSVVATENRCGIGVTKISNIIANSETRAVEMHGVNNESASISDTLGDTPVVTSDDGNEFSGIGENLEATPVVSSDVVSEFSAPIDIPGDMPVLMSDVVNKFCGNSYNCEATPVVRCDNAYEFSGIDDIFGATPVVTGEVENEFNIYDNCEATPDLAVDVTNKLTSVVDNCESTPVLARDYANKFSGNIDDCEATPVVVGDIANEFSGIIKNLPTTPSVTSVYPSGQSITVENDVNKSEPTSRGNIETFPGLMHSQSLTSSPRTDTDEIVCEESSRGSPMHNNSSSDIHTECMPKALQEPSATVLSHNYVGCDKISSGLNHNHLTPVQAAQTQTEELLSACHTPSDLGASTCTKVAGKHRKPAGQNYYECDNCQCRYLDVMLLVKHLLMHHSNPNQFVKNVYKSQTVLCNNSEYQQEQLMGDTTPTLHSSHVPLRRCKTIFSPRRSGRLVYSPLPSNKRTELFNNGEMLVNFSSTKNLTKKRGISHLTDGNGYDDTFRDRRTTRTILDHSNGDLNTGGSECLDYAANKHQKTKDTRKNIRMIEVTKFNKFPATNTGSHKDCQVNGNSQETIERNCSKTDSILMCQSSSDQLTDSSTIMSIFSTRGNNRTNNNAVAVTSYQTEVDKFHLQNGPSNSSASICSDEINEYTIPDNGIAALSASSSDSTCIVSSSISTKKSFARISGIGSKDTGTSDMEQDVSLACEFDLLSECDSSDLDFEGFSSTDITTTGELEGNETRKKLVLNGTDAQSNTEHLPGDIAPIQGLQVYPGRYISRTCNSAATELNTSITSVSQSYTSTTDMGTSINDIQSNATAKEHRHTVAELIPCCTSASHSNILTKEMCTPSNNMQTEGPSMEIQLTSLLGENSRIREYNGANSLQVLNVRNLAFQNTNNIDTQCTITDPLCVSDNLIAPVIILDDGVNVVETAQQSAVNQVSPFVSYDGLRANETTQQSLGSQVSPFILLDDVFGANETTQQSTGCQASPIILLDDGSKANETAQQLSSSSQRSLCLPLGAIQCNGDLESGCSIRRFSQDKPRLEVNDEAEVLFENTVLPKCEEKFLSSYYSYGSGRTMTGDLGTNLSVEEVDQLMKRCRPLTVVAKRHLVIIDGMKKFKCHECLHLVFDSLPLLRQHYSNIHGHGLKCIFCSQSFEHVGHLRLHLLNHGQVIKFKCTLCCAVFGRALDLQSHSCLCDTPPTLFKCHHCQSTFMSNSDLQLHISTTHFQDKPFKCEFCSSACQLRGKCVDPMKQVHDYNGD